VEPFAVLLAHQGFACSTVGRNFSAPESTAESARRLMRQSAYLVVVATPRFDAVDVHNRSVVRLPPGWIDGEAGLAHAQEIPITVFKPREVQLQGILAANTTQWFDFDFRAETPATYFLRCRELLQSHFNEVKQRVALARQKRQSQTITTGIGYAVGGALLLAIGASVAKPPEYPPCFGEHDGRRTICKDCPAKRPCKNLHDSRR
jgi:hypothetical protein